MRRMGEEWAKDDWCTIGRALVLHWFFIGSGLVFGMEFGTEFVPIIGEKTPFEKSCAKILHFFELCKSLGEFF